MSEPLTAVVLETELQALYTALGESGTAQQRLIMSKNTAHQLRSIIEKMRRFDGPHHIGKRKIRFIQTKRGVKIKPWKVTLHA